MSPYVKRPKAGDVLVHGRYGIVRVVSVHDRGRKLVVLDHDDHEYTTERAGIGTWIRADEDACVKAHNGEHRFEPLAGDPVYNVQCACGSKGVIVKATRASDLLAQIKEES